MILIHRFDFIDKNAEIFNLPLNFFDVLTGKIFDYKISFLVHTVSLCSALYGSIEMSLHKILVNNHIHFATAVVKQKSNVNRSHTHLAAIIILWHLNDMSNV